MSTWHSGKITALLLFALTLSTTAATTNRFQQLRNRSLCSAGEQIIFSCSVKRGAGRAGDTKIASLCASARLTKEAGYLQYRFGLPNKIELEYPAMRTATQQAFKYTHYMRFQVDLTEINFSIGDYQYQLFDNYNGEEKPVVSEAGINVMKNGSTNSITFACVNKPTADFSRLADVLTSE
jgi:hypothetical protein